MVGGSGGATHLLFKMPPREWRQMSIQMNEAPSDADVLDFLAAASDDTGDLPVITEEPIDVAKKYYVPDNRSVPYEGHQDAV